MPNMLVRRAGGGDRQRLLAFMRSVSPYFRPALSDRVCLEEWVEKMLDRGMVLIIDEKENIQGAIGFYCNDHDRRRAFITFLGVDKSVWRQGVGKRLLGEAIDICRRNNMKSALVTTEADNVAALTLYTAFGFTMDEQETVRTGKTTLRLSLGKADDRGAPLLRGG